VEEGTAPGSRVSRGPDLGGASATPVASPDDRYRALVELAGAVAAGGALLQTLMLAARHAATGLGASRCDLYDREPHDRGFVVAASHNAAGEADPSAWIGTRRAAETWPYLDECAVQRKAVAVYRDAPAITPGQAALLDGRGEQSCLTFPLVFGREVIGVADVGDSHVARRWSGTDVRYLQAVADLAAAAVAHARSQASLAEHSVVDELTGLYNLRHFTDQLRHEVAVCRRYGHDLSLLLVDLDDFRRFNQTHGRAKGDVVLREVAEILREVTRADVDILARYARDEFLVILPQTRANDPAPLTAATVAQRIHERVGAHRFVGEQGLRDVALTASVGVAGIGLGGYSADELLECAEKAVYLAKHEGKDRVVTFGA
jgi:diguanylate cyclase (GGDEF)-like protein